MVHHPAPIGAMMRAGSTGRGSVTLSNRPPSLAAWIMLHGIMPKSKVHAIMVYLRQGSSEQGSTF